QKSALGIVTRCMVARMKCLALVVMLVAAASGACSGSSSGGPPDVGTPPKTWTWVPVPGTQCMNGSATGIGVNLGTSGDLVLYLEGGGACFNTSTCATVAHQNGFGATEFATAAGDYTTGLFDRSDAKNPLKDATFVFVPYCTGDIHAGSNPTGFNSLKQVGYLNMGKDLEYLLPKSTNVTRVILSGSSAGGFGAPLNFHRTQPPFGAVPRTLI